MTRLVQGLQPAREAVHVHGKALEALLVEREAGPRLDGLVRLAEGLGVPVRRVSGAELDRLTAGGRHQGAVALAPELRLFRLDELELGEAPLLVALDGIMDPQNFGAVVRSAVALGATAVLWPEHSSAPLTPATFRASAGAIEHAKLCRVRSLPDALEALAARGVRAYGLDASASVELGGVDLTGPTALVIGSEDRGLHRAVRRACAGLAKLPMGGPIGSLNASVAAALGLYEAKRQRA